MNKKLMLLALAAVSAAIFALPSVASAAFAHISSTGNFTLANEGNTTLTEHGKTTKVTCTSATGTGAFTTTTEGSLTISFHGCTENVFGSECTGNAGGVHESKGTITTTSLKFHLIEIENNVPGVLLTANNGHFATFTCAGGLVSKVVGGNGIVGQITSTCGVSNTTHTIDFETVANTVGSTQKYTQTTTTGNIFDLTSNATTTASQVGSGNITFSDGTARSIVCT